MEAIFNQILGELKIVRTVIQVVKLRQDELFKVTQAINHNQDIANAKIEPLTMSDHYNIQDILTALKDGQERQDRILESLGMRSLEQEKPTYAI
jgi:hypothetical protein